MLATARKCSPGLADGTFGEAGCVPFLHHPLQMNEQWVSVEFTQLHVVHTPSPQMSTLRDLAVVPQPCSYLPSWPLCLSLPWKNSTAEAGIQGLRSGANQKGQRVQKPGSSRGGGGGAADKGDHGTGHSITAQARFHLHGPHPTVRAW